MCKPDVGDVQTYFGQMKHMGQLKAGEFGWVTIFKYWALETGMMNCLIYRLYECNLRYMCEYHIHLWFYWFEKKLLFCDNEWIEDTHSRRSFCIRAGLDRTTNLVDDSPTCYHRTKKMPFFYSHTHIVPFLWIIHIHTYFWYWFPITEYSWETCHDAIMISNMHQLLEEGQYDRNWKYLGYLDFTDAYNVELSYSFFMKIRAWLCAMQ